MKPTGELISAMIEYYSGDVKRINHFLKVNAFAKAIGENEGLDNEKQETLEVAAIVHDIGIKISETKYNSSAGKYQEIEGTAISEEFLRKLNYGEKLIERVCFLVGHHHTYHKIDDIDFQILVEADFLVNIYEDQLPIENIKAVEEKIFKTGKGREYLRNLYMKQ
ncbi:HD domain-containing protein [Clostridium sp. 19966]|uniref:HD domain-containing protein n=1 Tax=Clostridium sp. 19966 TaxID=2768166 RepID=UPI0028DFBFCB|nr:HD domain-containing protein [Clostridium sp. 19966]MDT8715168.1 HD domain-containing protein [Clostridium sp. 19966]